MRCSPDGLRRKRLTHLLSWVMSAAVHYWVGGLALCVKRGGEILIDRLAMADGHEANDPRLGVDRIDDSKAADAIVPQAAEFAHERLPTLRIGRNPTNSCLDGPF